MSVSGAKFALVVQTPSMRVAMLHGPVALNGFQPTTRSTASSVNTASSAVSIGLAGNDMAFPTGRQVDHERVACRDIELERRPAAQVCCRPRLGRRTRFCEYRMRAPSGQ